MPKALCILGMAVAALLLLLFGLDMGLSWPFRGANKMMDIAFIVTSLILAYLSWMTYREQV